MDILVRCCRTSGLIPSALLNTANRKSKAFVSWFQPDQLPPQNENREMNGMKGQSQTPRDLGSAGRQRPFPFPRGAKIGGGSGQHPRSHPTRRVNVPCDVTNSLLSGTSVPRLERTIFRPRGGRNTQDGHFIQGFLLYLSPRVEVALFSLALHVPFPNVEMRETGGRNASVPSFPPPPALILWSWKLCLRQCRQVGGRGEFDCTSGARVPVLGSQRRFPWASP